MIPRNGVRVNLIGGESFDGHKTGDNSVWYFLDTDTRKLSINKSYITYIETSR